MNFSMFFMIFSLSAIPSASAADLLNEGERAEVLACLEELESKSRIMANDMQQQGRPCYLTTQNIFDEVLDAAGLYHVRITEIGTTCRPTEETLLITPYGQKMGRQFCLSKTLRKR